MKQFRSTARANRIGAFALALTATTGLVLTGCATESGSGGDTASPDAGGVSQEVLDRIDTYTQPQPLDFAGSPFDVSSVAGKTVWWVLQEGANPFLTTVLSHAQEAFATVDVEVVVCDGKSNPVDANNCIKQAVAQGADAIQVDGPEPETFANAAQAAVDAGIPVLVGAGIDASQTPPDYIAGVTSQPFALTGVLAADWVIADSNGAANVLVITTPDVIGSGIQSDAFQDEISTSCPDCKVSVEGVTLGNWASDLGPTVSAALQRDPTIDYVFPVFDPMTQFTNPAILQAGKADTVSVVTVNGNLPFMQDMATGTSPTKAMVGLDLNALGWIEADQVLRVLTGNATVPDDYTNSRLFTLDNIADLELTAEAFGDSSWYAGTGTTPELFASIWQK